MRDCEGYRDWISASFDHRLDATETEELAAHLAACPDCRHAHEDMDAGDALLRRSRMLPLPEGFENRVVREARRIPRAPQGYGHVGMAAAAATLLAVLGLLLVVPARREAALRREVSDHIDHTKPFLALAQSAGDRELPLLREEAKLFELKRRTESLKKLASAKPELLEYVAAAEAILRHLDEGNVAAVRDTARHTAVLELLSRVREAKPLKVDNFTFSLGTPIEVQSTVRGHIQYLRGDFKAAAEDLAVSQMASGRLLHAAALREDGDVQQALTAYVQLGFASAHDEAYTQVAVARGLMGTARKSRVYVGTVNVAASSEAMIVQAMNNDGVICQVAGPQVMVITREASDRARELSSIVGVERRDERGVTIVTFNAKTLALDALAKIKSIDAIRLALQEREE